MVELSGVLIKIFIDSWKLKTHAVLVFFFFGLFVFTGKTLKSHNFQDNRYIVRGQRTAIAGV